MTQGSRIIEYDERTIQHASRWNQAAQGTQTSTGILGVLAAAEIYAILLVVGMFAQLLYEYPVRTSADFADVIGGLLGYLFLAIVLAAVAVLPATVIVLGVAQFCLHTLRTRPPWPAVMGFSGGLVGFLFSSTVFIGTSYENWGYGGLIIVLCGPVMATLFGQIGGVWATVPAYYTLIELLEEAPKPEFEVRFGIRQILIVTAWFAVLLAVIKITNVLGPWSEGIIIGWFVYQAATLWIVLRVVKKVRGYV